VWIWAWEALLLSCAHRRGRCKINIFLPTISRLHPRSAPLPIILIVYAWLQPSGLVQLKSMQGLWRCRISCVGTHIWLRQGHPRNTPSRFPPPNTTLQHQAIMQVQLSPGRRQDWSKFEKVLFSLKWCKALAWKKLAKEVPRWVKNLPSPDLDLTSNR